MIRSMTGFGAADGEVGGGRVSVEVRSKLHANDTRVLREGALNGIGVAVLPHFLVAGDLEKPAGPYTSTLDIIDSGLLGST